MVTSLGVHGQPVEGTVRVVLDPFDAADLRPGEILICPITDPSWVSLFYLAAAVVVDIGGPLSHGAIVARVDPTTGTVTPLP